MKRSVTLILALLIVPGLCTCLTFPLGIETERPSLKFDPAGLPEGQVGVTYDVKVTVSENVTPVGEFSLVEGSSLPPGLELVRVEGEDAARITGTPTTAGTYTFTLDVWCYGTMVNGQTGAQEYTIVIR